MKLVELPQHHGLLNELGRCIDAAAAWIEAATLCPEDGRAKRLLEKLAAERPEIGIVVWKGAGEKA